MAFTYSTYCPKCRTERVQHQEVSRYSFEARLNPTRGQTPGGLHNIYLRCNGCSYPRAILVLSRKGLSKLTGEISLFEEIEILADYPERVQTTAPEHTPDRVANLFLQASKSLESGHPDASGSMSRKSLDVATKDLGAPRDVWLKARITWLYQQHRLTEQLKDWAEIIKDDGNSAVHDEAPFTIAEAKELLDFTELFLTYVYTLPGKISARQKMIAATGLP